MTQIVIVDNDGREVEIEASDGTSVMEAAVGAGLSGMAADCGGGMACATCHCYVDENWYDKLDAPSQVENDMLAFAASPRTETSRLSCQIVIGPELEGLRVTLPETQY
jgi:2Fe-2S ferredoxin